MAKPRKGVIPPQLRKFIKKKRKGAKGRKKSMPAFIKKKLGR
jgi:hypothetical protein